MEKVWMLFFLVCNPGSHLTSAVYVRSPEEVVVGNGTTDPDCGVPAHTPKVPGCPPSDGLGIINGQEAEAHSWPWQVSLKTYCDDLFCGGSLINKDWVVTAAHCEVRTCDRVILGQHNLKEADDIQKKKIGKVFNHHKFNPLTLDYDIALIKLQSPAQMNKHVSPVCVAKTSDNIKTSVKCVATGWGRTHYKDKIHPDALQQVCMPLITKKNCNYKGITRRMFCAGAAGGDTCKGDSGGPLVCEMDAGRWILVGITSWGTEDCNPLKPGVFSKITALSGWMNDTMTYN